MDTQVITSPSGKAMKELLIQHKEALNFLHPGDIIEGRVLAKSSKRLFLDLDYFKPGIVYKSEMFEDPDEVRQMKIGDTISGMVVEPEN
ncbi:S1 RNA-binding domain-containing protein, partial [Patescibacteria group bacterium]|nr:S1 RNA-binding domain-containing protein [Patescibacteria group bacterium]